MALLWKNVCYKVGLTGGDYSALRVYLAGFRGLLLREGEKGKKVRGERTGREF